MSAQDGPPAEPEPGGESMTVEIGGTSRRLPAEHDYTGDGRPDAAVETPDGRVVVYSDSEDNETGAAEPDGRADEAWVVDKSTGRAVGEAHVERGTGEWVDDPSGPPNGPSGPPDGASGPPDGPSAPGGGSR
jgi:hypothetical protein